MCVCCVMAASDEGVESAGAGRARRDRKPVDYRAQEAILDQMELSCDEDESVRGGSVRARGCFVSGCAPCDVASPTPVKKLCVDLRLGSELWVGVVGGSETEVK